MEQLLEVMAQDEPPVAERIQRLLLPSYLPGTTHCCPVVCACMCVCVFVCVCVSCMVA